MDRPLVSPSRHDATLPEVDLEAPSLQLPMDDINLALEVRRTQIPGQEIIHKQQLRDSYAHIHFTVAVGAVCSAHEKM